MAGQKSASAVARVVATTGDMVMAVRRYAALFVTMAILVGGNTFFGLFYRFGVLPTASAQSKPRSIKEELHKILEGLHGSDLPEGIARTNGRIEATELDVAAKYAGRLATVMVNEGDEVTAGQ